MPEKENTPYPLSSQLYHYFCNTIFRKMEGKDSREIPAEIFEAIMDEYESPDVDALCSKALELLYELVEKGSSHAIGGVETLLEQIQSLYEEVAMRLAYKAWVYGLKAGLDA